MTEVNATLKEYFPEVVLLVFQTAMLFSFISPYVRSCHCCPNYSPVGLRVGCPAALGQKEGDYFAQHALRKGRVNTFPH